jgi:hypothetical protein
MQVDWIGISNRLNTNYHKALQDDLSIILMMMVPLELLEA